MTFDPKFLLQLESTIKELFDSQELFCTGELWVPTSGVAAIVAEKLKVPGSGGQFYKEIESVLKKMTKAGELEESQCFCATAP